MSLVFALHHLISDSLQLRDISVLKVKCLGLFCRNCCFLCVDYFRLLVRNNWRKWFPNMLTVVFLLILQQNFTVSPTAVQCSPDRD